MDGTSEELDWETLRVHVLAGGGLKLKCTRCLRTVWSGSEGNSTTVAYLLAVGREHGCAVAEDEDPGELMYKRFGR